MLLVTHRSSYVAGAWVNDRDASFQPVIDPTTEQVIAEIEHATEAIADQAATAAHSALEAWSNTPPSERIERLRRVATLMREQQDRLTDVIVSEVGMARGAAKVTQVGAAIATFEDAANDLPAALEPEVIGNAVTVLDPVGVVVGITPWNFPLWQIALKVAPALAAGCTFVLKPAELTPLSAIALTEIMDEAGIPAGVFNLVLGQGSEVGACLSEHPLVDMVSLTGSTSAGRAVAAAAAGTLKKVSLELGGKGPLIVLPDADLTSAVRYGVSKCYMNNGQTCAALTRLLVPQESIDEAAQIAADAVSQFVLGDPRDPGVNLGPLVSERHRETVRQYIRSGVAQGARLVAGGAEAPVGLPTGWFVQPTVFAEVGEAMSIAKEEIFGPVLSIIGYTDEDDAIRIANDSMYGLAAGVIGADTAGIRRVANRLKVGCVFIGEAAPNLRAPFGGVKQSGYGRERGVHGILDYLVTKSLIGAVQELI